MPLLTVYVLKRVEDEVGKLCDHAPETIRLKSNELVTERRRLADVIEHIAEGRGGQAIGKALEETEPRVQALEEEIEGLQLSHRKVFQAPPLEWVQERASPQQ